jgi:transposase
MEKVIVPFNFEALPPVDRDKIVPICMARRDRHGKEIAWGWFEAVSKIQTPLRLLARRFLSDVWRVSELSDLTVQTVWDLHGEDFGRHPHRRIYVQAQWCARDLQAGTQRERRGKTVALSDLEQSIRTKALVDPAEYETRYIAGIQLSELGRRMEQAGRPDLKVMLDHLRDGCNWDEIGDLTGQSANTAQRRFWRWIGKVVEPMRGNL